MLAVLSPAKNLDTTDPECRAACTRPALMEDATQLMRTTRGLSQKRIRELMNLSPELAKLNYDRFHNFQLPFDATNALPAALLFNGDVYRGLDARSLSPADLEWAQDRIGILSGLFGLLRPLDLIQPYRLEMGARLKTRRGSNLYAFWGDRLARRLDALLEDHADPTLVNLASGEYFKAVDRKSLRAPVVQCVFEDWKEHPDDGKVVSFLAKYARGQMARFAIAERLDRAAGLKEFSGGGYAFQPKRSTADRWLFSRKFVPAAGAA